MSGGHLAKFKQSFKIRTLFGMTLNGLIIGATAFLIFEKTDLESPIVISLILALIIICSVIFSMLLSNILTKPTEYLSQAIFHVSPNEHFVAAPNVDELSFGKELVGTLSRQIYDYASVGQAILAAEPKKTVIEQEIVNQAPVGIFGLDSFGNIKFVNKTAIDVFKLTEEANGLPLETQLNIRFVNQSIDDWIKTVKEQSINSNKIWRKADITSGRSGEVRSYYDIAAIYRQGHASGIETLLAFFNHDDTFKVEEDALNLIALSVHEIRTPLTILRGYVDALKEELDGKLDDQNQQYFNRLSASSQNLSTFLSNVLNVVRADQNQLSLAFSEEKWDTCLKLMVDNLRERCAVRGKELSLNISAGLPTVALDKVSVNEVITNLVDNAIKYSPATAKNIWIESSLNTDGMILTTVRDEGVGIPDSVIPNLFTKFLRNHRTAKHVTGTGLGLFLSKAIVSAHHGNIWVKSKEGQGTTVGFTLLPYSKLAEVTKDEDNGSQKVTHGWIKNHGMQRQ